MLDNFIHYLTAIHRLPYFLILVAGIITGALRFRRLSKANRFFFLLLCLTFINEITGYFYRLQAGNNAIVYNVFTVIQYSIIAIAFYIETRKKQFLAISLPVFYSFAIFNGVYWQSFANQFGSNLLLLESLFIIIWVMLFFITAFTLADAIPVYKYALFYLCVLLLLYSVVSIISFGFFKITKLSSEWNMLSFWVRAWTNYFLYFSFIIAFISPQKSLNDIPPGK